MTSNMLTSERADYLLHMSKRLLDNDNAVIILSKPKNRFLLSSETSEHKFQFMFEFSKYNITLTKITYHFQLQSRVALTRLDFGGGHQNPKTPDGAPDIAKPYIGYRFENEAHVHVFSPTHQLDWAVPIKEIDLNVKVSKDGIFDLHYVLNFFCNYIGLKDRITIQRCFNV